MLISKNRFYLMWITAVVVLVITGTCEVVRAKCGLPYDLQYGMSKYDAEVKVATIEGPPTSRNFFIGGSATFWQKKENESKLDNDSGFLRTAETAEIRLDFKNDKLHFCRHSKIYYRGGTLPLQLNKFKQKALNYFKGLLSATKNNVIWQFSHIIDDDINDDGSAFYTYMRFKRRVINDSIKTIRYDKSITFELNQIAESPKMISINICETYYSPVTVATPKP